MNRYALAVVLVSSLLANGIPTHAALTTNDELNRLCDGMQNSSNCADAIEAHQLARRVKGVARTGDRLSIRLATGKQVQLRSRDHGHPDGITFRYLEYLPAIDFHLVHIQYYEGNDYLLISNKNGSRQVLPSLPRISPERRHVVAVSASEGHNINGVFVFKLRAGRISPIFSHEPDEYALYSFVRWRGETAIELKKFVHVDDKECSGYQFMTVSVDLVASDDRWQFQPALGDKPVECRD